MSYIGSLSKLVHGVSERVIREKYATIFTCVCLRYLFSEYFMQLVQEALRSSDCLRRRTSTGYSGDSLFGRRLQYRQRKSGKKELRELKRPNDEPFCKHFLSLNGRNNKRNLDILNQTAVDLSGALGPWFLRRRADIRIAAAILAGGHALNDGQKHSDPLGSQPSL